MKRGILLMGLLALLSCRAKKELQETMSVAETQTLVDSMSWGGLKTQLQEVEATGREIDEVWVELSAWDDGIKKRGLKLGVSGNCKTTGHYRGKLLKKKVGNDF